MDWCVEIWFGILGLRAPLFAPIFISMSTKSTTYSSTVQNRITYSLRGRLGSVFNHLSDFSRSSAVWAHPRKNAAYDHDLVYRTDHFQLPILEMVRRTFEGSNAISRLLYLGVVISAAQPSCNWICLLFLSSIIVSIIDIGRWQAGWSRPIGRHGRTTEQLTCSFSETVSETCSTVQKTVI